MNFSVLLPVYYKDKAEWLSVALDSILQQTILPTEIIVIQDGQIPSSLSKKITEFQQQSGCKWIELSKNQGLANSLNVGIKNASYEWITRLDADDINVSDRYQKQIKFLTQNPEVDLVGGYSLEFANNPQGPYMMRKLPLTAKDVRSLLKKRNPINHGSIFYRKSAVLEAGGYEHYDGMEDYHLWVKMILKGFCLRNMPEKLVLARAGAGMLMRRGGWGYFKTELRLQYFFLTKGFINIWEFCRNIAIRAVVRMTPKFFRKIFYKVTRMYSV